MALLVDGYTPDGRHVVVTQGGHPLYDVVIKVNGEAVTITERPSLFRDGGTKHFPTERGLLVFPHKLGNPDRTPKLDGQPIT